MKAKLIGACTITLALLTALPEASAQYYGQYRQPQRRWGYRHRPHGYVGGQLMGYGIVAQVTDGVGYLRSGGGGGLFGGARLSPFFSLEGNWAISYHDEEFSNVVVLDSIYLMSFTVDGKLHIPTMGPVEPYFQAGIGYAFLGATYDEGDGDSVLASGPAFNLGGGLDVWLGPWITVGGRVLWRGLYFGDEGGAVRDDNFVNGVSVEGNVAFHF